jgi:pyridoxine kinase
MPLVLVISSYVAASRVGGGIAPYVLGPLKVDPVHVPTTLFGRHPGWGRPGGAPVPAVTMQDMLDGIAANGLFEQVDAVLTGYFATPDQVEVAARAIDAVRAARGIERAPIVMVDPVMGDRSTGLYVREETAQAQQELLVPRATIVACNHWEFERLNGEATYADAIVHRIGKSNQHWLVSSIPVRDQLLNLLAADRTGELCASLRIDRPVPNGTGDLLHLAYLGQLLNGQPRVYALRLAVGVVNGVLAKAVEWNAPELPLAACSALLADPPSAELMRGVARSSEWDQLR